MTPELLEKIRHDAEAAKGDHAWWAHGQHVQDTPPKPPHGWPSGPALLCCMRCLDEVPERNPAAAATHVANVDPATTLMLLDEIARLHEFVELVRGYDPRSDIYANDLHGETYKVMGLCPCCGEKECEEDPPYSAENDDSWRLHAPE